MEIESRLLPCGLHTVGVPPTAEEAIATLVNIASLDRPEEKIKGLPRILAESVGRDITEIYRNANGGLVSPSVTQVSSRSAGRGSRPRSRGVG